MTVSAAFVFGMAVGIGVHRFIMAMVLWEDPDTKSAYRKWMKRKRRHNQ